MHAAGILYRLALADFLERTRRYSFLITLLGTLFFGFLVITGKWTLRLGEYRGEYNSAWVGSLMGSASTCMLAIFGFYLVKNSLSRDRRTRVGEILAATPLSNRLYMASKFVSNLAVLTVMATTLAVAAIVMQLLSPVEAGLDVWALVAPFVFVCLPVMTLVAAAAVLFESIRPLRGTMGNILYLFIAEAALLSLLGTMRSVDSPASVCSFPAWRRQPWRSIRTLSSAWRWALSDSYPGLRRKRSSCFPGTGSPGHSEWCR